VETILLRYQRVRFGEHRWVNSCERQGHAWGDSNLYLRRDREQLWLSIEHRAAASAPALPAELHVEGDAVALRIVDPPPLAETAPALPGERILRVLGFASEPMTRRALRDACRMRAASVGDALTVLLDKGKGQIVEDIGGFRIARPSKPPRFPGTVSRGSL
jgi:hypothetical protein